MGRLYYKDKEVSTFIQAALGQQEGMATSRSLTSQAAMIMTSSSSYIHGVFSTCRVPC